MANPKVSLEEIRAKRLVTEQANAQLSQNENVISESTADRVLVQASQGQPGTESMPPITPAAASTPVASGLPKLPDLDAILATATPEQLSKLRSLAVQKGISVPSSTIGTKRADGSMTVDVYLEGPVVEQLELWAEADGCSLIEEAQKRINEALTNYLYGDWNPIPETVPAPITATAIK